MNARCTRHLSQATDLPFNIFGRGHHEIGQFVDDQHNVGQGLATFILLSFAHQRIIGFQIAHAHLLKEPIAVIHLQKQPSERTHYLIDLSDHLPDQMWDAVVARQLHHLRVNHHKTQPLRPMLHQEASDDGVNAD